MTNIEFNNNEIPPPWVWVCKKDVRLSNLFTLPFHCAVCIVVLFTPRRSSNLHRPCIGHNPFPAFLLSSPFSFLQTPPKILESFPLCYSFLIQRKYFAVMTFEKDSVCKQSLSSQQHLLQPVHLCIKSLWTISISSLKMNYQCFESCSLCESYAGQLRSPMFPLVSPVTYYLEEFAALDPILSPIPQLSFDSGVVPGVDSCEPMDLTTTPVEKMEESPVEYNTTFGVWCPFPIRTKEEFETVEKILKTSGAMEEKYVSLFDLKWCGLYFNSFL